MDVASLTKELISIDSQNPPGKEREIAGYISDFLEDTGLRSEMLSFGDGRYNVVADFGRGDGLAIGGHTDTIPIGNTDTWKRNPFGEISKGEVYGIGASDMKGGVACALSAVSSLEYDKAKRKVVLLFVGDEEVAFGGSDWILHNRRDLLDGVKYGIMGEPTYNDIAVAQKGIYPTKFKLYGKPAHGSKPWLGKNSIMMAKNLLDGLQKLGNSLEDRKDELLGHGTINVGKISGGIKVNVVPEYCEIEVDRRLIPSETFESVASQYQEIISKIDGKVEIELMYNPRMPMGIHEDSEIVKMLRDLTGAKSVGKTGYTECEMYHRELGIDFVSFGPGNSSQAHTIDEFVEIKKLEECATAYRNIIGRWAGV